MSQDSRDMIALVSLCVLASIAGIAVTLT